MFYSQADAGNGLTRGLDNELARRTYVPTKLDKELTGAILENKLRLVTRKSHTLFGRAVLARGSQKKMLTRGRLVRMRRKKRRLAGSGILKAGMWVISSLSDSPAAQLLVIESARMSLSLG